MKKIKNVTKTPTLHVIFSPSTGEYRFIRCWKCNKPIRARTSRYLMHARCWEFCTDRERDQADADLGYAILTGHMVIPKGIGRIVFDDYDGNGSYRTNRISPYNDHHYPSVEEDEEWLVVSNGG